MTNNKIEKLLAYYENNTEEFNNDVKELDSYNGWLNDDRYYLMDDFDEMHYGVSPSEIARRIFFGNFNPNHEFFKYNAYGNLESDYEEDYSNYLYKNTVEEIINLSDHLCLSDGATEIIEEEEEEC